MFPRHLICKVFSLLMSCCVTGQVSAPYRRTYISVVRKTHILVALPRLWLLKTFLLLGTLYQPSQASLQLLSLLWHSDPPHSQVRERLHFLQCLAPQCDGWLKLVPYLSVLTLLFNCENLGLAHTDLHAPPGTGSVQDIQHVL